MAFGNILGQQPDLSSYALKTDLDNYLPLVGGTVTGNISMSNNKITNLANGINNNDAVNLGQLLNNNIPIEIPNIFNTTISGDIGPGYGTYTAYVRNNYTLLVMTIVNATGIGATDLVGLHGGCWIEGTTGVYPNIKISIFLENGTFVSNNDLIISAIDNSQVSIVDILQPNTYYAILPFCYYSTT